VSIRILLADDHKIVRDGLRCLLEGQEDMEVVGEAEEGRTAVELASTLSPNVVILDISMPDLNGVDAAKKMTAKAPGVKVIALSMHSDRRFVEGMFRAGAAGYLLKDCAFEELARAVRAVAGGQTYLSPAISTVLVADYLSKSEAAEAVDVEVLTTREREVLQLLAEGHSTKAVAARLHVSVKTIETHRQRVMAKLDLHSIAGLTKYAIREGLTSPDC
jgi:two-component system response regulator NreC